MSSSQELDINSEFQFGIWDYVVCGTTLLISSSIGVYYRFTGGKQNTADEYLLGGKDMSVLPVAFSLMASFMSAITMLGVVQETYTYGTQFVLINLAYLIGTPIAAYVYLPVFFRMQNTSAYAYLEKRFGYTSRLVASLAFSIQMILYMGVVIHAPSIALSTVTGLSYLGSVFAVGCVCTFYSTLGGMKAVLLTDVFQALLMFAAIITIVISGSMKVGSFSEIYQRNYDAGRIQFDEISPDPTVRHTIWTQLVGGIFSCLSVYGVNQAQLQRLLSIKDLKRAQHALWLQWPIMVFLSILTLLAGLVIFAYYKDCDPVLEGRIKSGGQLLPLFVVETMGRYPGLSGLFVSGIFSGSLSTVSSAINSLAAVTFEDYIKPMAKLSCCKKIETSINEKASFILKILALIYGCICVAMTFLCNQLGSGMLQAAMSIFGIVGGPLLGLFTLGMLTRQGNEPGALTGFLSALSLLFWMSFGKPRPLAKKLPVSVESCGNQFPNMIFQTNSSFQITDSTKIMEQSIANKLNNQDITEDSYFYLYRISYAWYAFIGFIITFTVGFIVSFVAERIVRSGESRREKQRIDPNLFADPMKNRLSSYPLTEVGETQFAEKCMIDEA